MKRWIHAATDQPRNKPADKKMNSDQLKGYQAAKQFKKDYPRAYEVLGK